MKLIGVALSLLIPLVSVPNLAAQSGTESKTKVTVKDGKDVKVTGCVAQAGGASGYMLTNVADKKGALHSYMLVGDNDLSKYVGHRVQLEGKVTDRGDAKVNVETKTKTKVEHGDTEKSTTKAQFEGDVAGMSYLGVKSVKNIAAVCP